MSEPPEDTPGPDEQVGSVADEAARLFGALSDWARDATEEVNEHVDNGSAECTWCPLCRTVHAVRQAGPEVGGHLAVAASALMQAAAGLLAAVAPAEPAGDARRGPGVEHIHVDGDADGDAGDTQGDTDGAWPEEDE